MSKRRLWAVVSIATSSAISTAGGAAYWAMKPATDQASAETATAEDDGATDEADASSADASFAEWAEDALAPSAEQVSADPRAPFANRDSSEDALPPASMAAKESATQPLSQAYSPPPESPYEVGNRPARYAANADPYAPASYEEPNEAPGDATQTGLLARGQTPRAEDQPPNPLLTGSGAAPTGDSPAGPPDSAAWGNEPPQGLASAATENSLRSPAGSQGLRDSAASMGAAAELSEPADAGAPWSDEAPLPGDSSAMAASPFPMEPDTASNGLPPTNEPLAGAVVEPLAEDEGMPDSPLGQAPNSPLGQADKAGLPIVEDSDEAVDAFANDYPGLDASPAPQEFQAPMRSGAAPTQDDTHSVLSERNSLREPAAQPQRMASLGPAASPAPNTFRDDASGALQAPADFDPPTSDALVPIVAANAQPGEQALEGVQQPSLTIQKLAPAEIQVGKPCKFLIKVRNVGRRPAENVVVRDTTPAGATLNSATPEPETEGSGLVWNLGTISPGEERTVEMELTPTTEGEIGSVATVAFAARASVKTICTRPQLALRLTAPSKVQVGRTQLVQIELHNPGTGDATNVMLLENVPENVAHEAGPSLEFEVGTLRAGETRRMELVLTARKAGQVSNVLRARADGNLAVEQSVDFEVVAPDLEVAVEGPSKRYLERPATYTVSIGNPGTAKAQDIRLVTKLPRGMKFVRANNLGEYDATSHAVYWSLAELPEGGKGTVELVAMPIEAGEQTLSIEGAARDGLRDNASQRITVEGVAAINFEVLDVADPIELGGDTSYEVRVVNQGTKAATNVQVRMTAPEGLRIESARGETPHTVQSGAVTFKALPQLAPGAEAMFRVTVKGVRSGDQRILVEVGSDELTDPIRKEESTRVFGDE